MDMHISRRSFGKIVAGGAAAVAAAQLSRTAAVATPVAGYKAMVGIFLFGGNDGWNMVVPNDSRYATYASTRNAALVLPKTSLTALSGSAFSLNSALSPLASLWDQGAMNLVLNTGTLYQPLTRAQFLASPDLRPVNLMSHADEQAHWQGLRARDISSDGFMGRLSDRATQTTVPSNISISGANLISIGKTSTPLILASSAIVAQEGQSNSADPGAFARNSAVTSWADTSGAGTITGTTGSQVTSAYSQNVAANSILSSATSAVTQYFVDGSGKALTSDIALQLLRVARLIEARGTLAQSRQTFFVSQGGYDTHTNEVPQQAALYTDLGLAVAAFYNAMKALGLAENVTAFTMSDFGRSFAGNAQGGADHAWGNNHFVIGGALKPKTVHGTYPSLVMGGADDSMNDGRFIPTVAQEEYIGAIAKWHGVADADLPYVFPNWTTWSTNGRGPLAMFAS